MNNWRKCTVITGRNVVLGALVSWMTLGAVTAQEIQTGTFAERISSIDQFEGQIIAKDFLLVDPGFLSLSNDAANNIVPCVSYLSLIGHSHQQRMIAILSMHSLGPADYVRFLSGIIELYDHNSISKYELGLALGPTYEFSTTLIDNYDRADVQTILKSILKRPGIDPDDRAGILEILSGQALKEKTFFLQNCCTPGPKN